MNLVRGKKYNWKNQPERLVYLGVSGRWHQFALVDEPDNVWCQLFQQDLHMLEETVPDMVFEINVPDNSRKLPAMTYPDDESETINSMKGMFSTESLMHMPVVTVEQVHRFREAALIVSRRLAKTDRMLEDKSEQVVDLMDALLTAEKERDELFEALKKYGDHHRQCGIGGSHTEGDCECGFVGILVKHGADYRQVAIDRVGIK